MKQTKPGHRIGALLLAIVMVLSILPTTAFAADDDPVSETADVIETEAPETEAPETEAPETEAPVTEPEETEAPETEPEETEAPETEAPETEPEETEAPETEPEETVEETTEETEDVMTLELIEPRGVQQCDYEYSIVHLDAGRKYFSVNSIKQVIDTSAAAGFNQLQLAFGNDGLRFLLDDMSFTVNGKAYDSNTVKSRVQSGNASYSGDNSCLTQAEMDEIIAYADAKGMEIVPLLNMPGHMDAVLDIAQDAYNFSSGRNKSVRTLDISNDEAVAFAYAVLQKYVRYFATKGCQFFNFGADEFANDVLTSSGMGFGYLVENGKYGDFVDFVNGCAEIIENAGMTPRAFNDGFYYNNTLVDFDSEIQICYWSSGWSGYKLASAKTIAEMGHAMINTNDSFYYALRNDTMYQCTADHALEFKYKSFAGNATLDYPAGAMFCIWCDQPNYKDEQWVLDRTADVITNFGSTLPEVREPDPVDPSEPPVEDQTVCDKETNICVTAPGLEEIKVQAANTAALPEGYTAGKTYSITLNNGAYTGAATVKIPYDAEVFAGCTEFTGVVGENTFPVTLTDNTFVCEVPHFSDVTVAGRAAAAATKNETVTLGVDELSGEYMQDGLVGTEGTYTTEDGVASYKIEHIPGSEGTTMTLGSKIDVANAETSTGVISDGNGNYLVVDANGAISNTKEIMQATTFTVTRSGGYGNYTYTIQGAGRYLYVNRTGFWNYTYSLSTQVNAANWTYNNRSNGFTSSSYTSYRIRCNNGTWMADTTGNGFLYSVNKGTESTSAQTKITFTGKKVGTTEVTLGDTRYTVVVQEKAPTGALNTDTLKLEYWITNYTVHETANSSSPSSHTITRAAASTEEGIEITSIIPDPAYSFFNNTVTVYYWKSVRLDSNNWQTGASQDDETQDGTTMTHIRYTNAWQYKTADGEWHYFMSGDQAVAYYLQKTEIDNRIGMDVYAKDWGFEPSTTKPSDASNKQISLSVAVVYEGNVMYPTEENLLANTTTIFNYWADRDIGIIVPKDLAEGYEISKITVTSGTYTGRKNSAGWWTSTSGDVFDWEMKANTEGGSAWYDEVVAWDDTMDTEPAVYGKNLRQAGTWPKVDSAKLVLIYLKPVEKDSNLLVNYVDDSADGTIFSTAQIVVKEGDNFLNGLQQNSPVHAGSITLDDEAYIVNSTGAQQTFNKDITVLDVAPKYRTGLYEYVGADIAENGMVLNLHYSLDTTRLKPNYILDFGLPTTFTLRDIVDNPDAVKKVEVNTNGKTTFGTISYNSDTKTFTYTPTQVLTSSDIVRITLTMTDNSTLTWRVGFTPASNVLYEAEDQSFMSGSSWNKSSHNLGYQDNDHLSAADQKPGHTESVYGYDRAYANSTGTNGGYSITASGNGATSALTTSFRGNAFDLIGECGTDTGIAVLIIKNAQNQGKAVIVDTSFNDSNYGTISQVPWAHVVMDKVDNYDVEVTGYYRSEAASRSTFGANGGGVSDTLYAIMDDLDAKGFGMGDVEFVYFDEASPLAQMNGAVMMSLNADNAAPRAAATRSSGGKIVVDAFRVYTSTDNSAYVGQELNLTYTNVLDAVNNTNFAAYVEANANGTWTAADYEVNGGPQNEIYLANNQAIAFKTSGNIVQISARAVKYQTAMNSSTITSNTEMYYTVTPGNDGVVTIQNTSGNLLALGNIKSRGMQKMTAADIQMVCDMLSAPVEPEEPENPEKTSVPLYRLYSPVTGEHLYTSDESEWDFLGTVGWVQEGIAWYAATEGDPVYRLYNAGDGTHLYTMNEKEIEDCVAMGWTVDGVVTYSAGDDGVPVVRLYSPVAVNHYHLYTVSRDEIDENCARGWIEEGIAWYAAKS